MPANHLPVGSTMSTVHLSSDGTYFYWIWSPASLNEKTPKGHSVFMDIFELGVRFPFCLIVSLQRNFDLVSFCIGLKRTRERWSRHSVFTLSSNFGVFLGFL